MTAALRGANGCADTDNNAADFSEGAPNPRNSQTTPHFCSAENAPSVSSTIPPNSATGVARNANVTITFSEAVNAADGWYTISCSTSGSHTATQSGGTLSFTLDPATDFAFSETCTVTVFAANVTDQDALDPPDTMEANHVFTFTTENPPVLRSTTCRALALSPLAGQRQRRGGYRDRPPTLQAGLNGIAPGSDAGPTPTATRPEVLVFFGTPPHPARRSATVLVA